jgi:hypothetical protein
MAEKLMKIDLHTHTCYSFDCNTAVDKLIHAAEEAGLEAIAITDHDSISAVRLAQKLSDKITIIPGMEISTWKGTHLIGLFLKNKIESKEIFEVIDEIHEQGGLAVLPHPFRRSSGFMYAKDKHQLYTADEARELLSRIDLVETVNLNCTMEALTDADIFFACFPDIPQSAGRDAHTLNVVGKAYVDLEEVKSNSLEDIKEALLKSSRLIRFEAYQADTKEKSSRVKRTSKRKTILKRAMKYIQRPIGRSIGTMFRNSTKKLFGSVKKSTIEKNGKEKIRAVVLSENNEGK